MTQSPNMRGQIDNDLFLMGVNSKEETDIIIKLMISCTNLNGIWFKRLHCHPVYIMSTCRLLKFSQHLGLHLTCITPKSIGLSSDRVFIDLRTVVCTRC